MVILVYAAKGINFGDDTYVMRIQLAALDWVYLSHWWGGGVTYIAMWEHAAGQVWFFGRTALNRTNNYMQV